MASRGEGEEGRMGRAELCVQDERRGAKGLDQIGERRKKPAAPGTGRAGAEQQGGTGKKQKHIKTGDKEGKERTEKRMKETTYSKASLQKAGKRRRTRKQKRTGKRKEQRHVRKGRRKIPGKDGSNRFGQKQGRGKYTDGRIKNRRIFVIFYEVVFY